MTTWLDFRAEPIMDVPEVEIRVLPKRHLPRRYRVICQKLDCDFTDDTRYLRDAEDLKYTHQQWHEEGMPA